MLKPKLTPSRLSDPSERGPIVVAESVHPPRYRAFYILRQSGVFLWSLLGLTFTGKLTRKHYARRFRELLESLGGLWIKVGQLLSFRIDMFSQEFCNELSKLQGQAVGFPPQLARQIVEEELGVPLERYFDEFAEMPFAAASIGQIHRAHLREENVWVAVKVQRPYLAKTFADDMVIIQKIVWFLQLISFRPFMHWEEGLRELRHIMNEELDCRYEGSAFLRMRKSLKKHGIYVPKVFSRYGRRRILVTEFIDAVLMADYIRVANSDPAKLTAWLEQNEIDPKSVARQLFHTLHRQLLEDNLYHGDLHPGNIILLRESRIALIDFGAIAFTEREYLQKFRLFFHALVMRDYAKAADTTLLLGGAVPVTDMEVVKGSLIEALRAWGARILVKGLPYREKSLDGLFVELTKIMFRYKCDVRWALLRMTRASATLEASLVSLDPHMDALRLVEEYKRRSERRAFRKATRELAPQIVKSLTMAMRVGESTYENALYQSSVIRRQAQVFQRTTGKFAYLFAVLFGQVAAGQLILLLFLLAAFLYQHHRAFVRPLMGEQVSRLVQLVPPFDYQVWMGILIISIYFFFGSIKLLKRFSEKEARYPESNTP
jgi:ubiquinone biosynthesis protein